MDTKHNNYLLYLPSYDFKKSRQKVKSFDGCQPSLPKATKLESLFISVYTFISEQFIQSVIDVRHLVR